MFAPAQRSSPAQSLTAPSIQCSFPPVPAPPTMPSIGESIKDVPGEAAFDSAVLASSFPAQRLSPAQRSTAPIIHCSCLPVPTHWRDAQRLTAPAFSEAAPRVDGADNIVRRENTSPMPAPRQRGEEGSASAAWLVDGDRDLSL